MGCVGSDPSAALDPWNGRHTGLALDEATMSLALIATDAWVARLVCRAFRDGCPREPQSGVERPACRAFRDGGPHGPPSGVAASVERARWAIRIGCPSARVCREAAGTGRLDVLRWAWSRGMRAVRAIPEAAARGGHLATLEWLHARKCTSENVCLEAAAAGHIHVLEWARDHEHTWRRDFSSAAARNGHVGVLQWIRANGLTWDCVIYEAAAAGGRVNVLSWLASEGYVEHCALTNNVCENAARGPHLEALKWAREHGYPWGRTCYLASYHGHLELLQWACAHGCDPTDMTGRHPHVRQWMVDTGRPVRPIYGQQK